SCVIVPHRPFFNGSPGCVRSNACIWLFSSKHSTKALSGGFIYNPTTSVSFSRNFASRDSLNVRLRCGLILCSCHKRFTVFLLTPCAFAFSRQLQLVMTLGLLFTLAWMLRSLCLFSSSPSSPRPRARPQRRPSTA